MKNKPIIKRSDGSTSDEYVLETCNSDDFCDAFVINWINKIHEACEHAALNGHATKLDGIKFCPWCGSDEAIKQTE